MTLPIPAAKEKAVEAMDFLQEMCAELREHHPAAAVETTRIFWNHIRDEIDVLIPRQPARPASPSPTVQAGSAGQDSPATEIDEGQWYPVEINGRCRKLTAGGAALVEFVGEDEDDIREEFFPKKLVGDPERGDEIGTVRLPGDFIIEKRLEELVVQ